MTIRARMRYGAHQLLQRLGYDIHRYPGADFDVEMRAILRRVKPYTVTRAARLFALRQAVHYIVKANVPGAIVETGVWRGGSMMAAAYSLLELRDTSRDLYLFDTFSGMDAPTADDVRVDGIDAASLLAAEAPSEAATSAWKVAGIEDVRSNMASTGYPGDKIRFVKGRVQDTVPALAPDTIALLRLDTDWYDSTRHEMEHLFPRLCQRGVLIVDDYGHWGGARRAVDEYLARNGLELLLHRVDDSARVAVKMPPVQSA